MASFPLPLVIIKRGVCNYFKLPIFSTTKAIFNGEFMHSQNENNAKKRFVCVRQKFKFHKSAQIEKVLEKAEEK